MERTESQPMHTTAHAYHSPCLQRLNKEQPSDVVTNARGVKLVGKTILT